MGRALPLALVLLAIAVVGCSSDEPETVASLSKSEQEVLPTIDGSQLLTLLAEHKDSLVVVAAWSAADPASAELYPKLAELTTLAPPGAKTGVVVVAVNLDGLNDVREKALPLARQQDPKVVNRVLLGGPMELMGAMDPDWPMVLPTVWIRSQGGKRAGRFTGRGALDEAKERLAKLIR